MLFRAYGAVIRYMAPFFAQYGLNNTRLNVLRLLYDAPEQQLTMSQVMEGLNVTSTNVTRLVGGLVRSGLARRVASPLDRRVMYAQLTPLGAARYEQVLPLTLQRLERLWQHLSATESLQLVRALSKLAHAASTPQEPPG